MIRQRYQTLATWAGFMGWMTLILGGLNTLVGGFSLYVVGGLPGIISVFLGWKMIKAAESARELMMNPSDNENQEKMVDNLATLFMVQGIFAIIGFIILLIAVIVFMSVGASYLSTFANR